MGDAPRHLAPGRHALHLLELGEVVEHQHHAQRLVPLVLEPGEVDPEREGLVADGDAQGALDGTLARAVHLGQELLENLQASRIEDPAVILIEDLRLVDMEQLLGKAVDGGYPAAGIHRDDAGRHVLQDDLGVAPPLIKLQVGVAQGGVHLLDLLLAGRQITHHQVEGVHQGAHLVAGLSFQDEVEFALGNPPGGLGQLVDGTGEAGRHIEAEPDGTEDDEQGDDEQHDQQAGLDRVLEQHELAVALEPLGDQVHALQPLAGNEHGGDQHLALAPAGQGRNRGQPPHQLAGRHRLDADQIALAGDAAAQHLGRHLGHRLRGEPRPDGPGPHQPLAGDHLHAGHTVVMAELLQHLP